MNKKECVYKYVKIRDKKIIFTYVYIIVNNLYKTLRKYGSPMWFSCIVIINNFKKKWAVK